MGDAFKLPEIRSSTAADEISVIASFSTDMAKRIGRVSVRDSLLLLFQRNRIFLQGICVITIKRAIMEMCE